MKFVCAFAWADLHVQVQEKDFVQSMVDRLGLNDEETAQVQAWLEVPPKAEEVNPNDIPERHRRLFLDAVRVLVMADGEVNQVEAENLALLEQILGVSEDTSA